MLNHYEKFIEELNALELKYKIEIDTENSEIDLVDREPSEPIEVVFYGPYVSFRRSWIADSADEVERRR